MFKLLSKLINLVKSLWFKWLPPNPDPVVGEKWIQEAVTYNNPWQSFRVYEIMEVKGGWARTKEGYYRPESNSTYFTDSYRAITVKQLKSAYVRFTL